mgnify:CR=1 FL=1
MSIVDVRPEPVVGEQVTLYLTGRPLEDKPDYWHENIKFYEFYVGSKPGIDILDIRLASTTTDGALAESASSASIQPQIRDGVYTETIARVGVEIPMGSSVSAELDFVVTQPGEHLISIYLNPWSENGSAGSIPYILWINSTDTQAEFMNWRLRPTAAYPDVIFVTQYLGTPGLLTPAPSRTSSPSSSPDAPQSTHATQPVIIGTAPITYLEPVRPIIGTPVLTP